MTIQQCDNCFQQMAGFWRWAHFAPKLGHFCPEVRLILPLKLWSKCWKNNTDDAMHFLHLCYFNTEKHIANPLLQIVLHFSAICFIVQTGYCLLNVKSKWQCSSLKLAASLNFLFLCVFRVCQMDWAISFTLFLCRAKSQVLFKSTTEKELLWVILTF